MAALAADLGVMPTTEGRGKPSERPGASGFGMTTMRRGLLIGAAVYTTSWLALAFGIWESVATAEDVHTAMRLVPYVNVHLMEEIAENQYSPWTDYVFLLRVFVVSGAPILFGAWVAGRIGGWASGGRIVCLAVFMLVVMNWHVLASAAPVVLRAAFLRELFVATTLGVLGAWLSTRRAGAAA
jgi:hypothetical protein